MDERNTGGQTVDGAAPAAFVSFETGKRYKVHHSYIWLNPLAATFSVFILAVIGNIDDIMRGYQALQSMGYSGVGFVIGFVLLILLVVYAILVALHAIAYHFLGYEFDEREFSLYSGFITKKHVHVPYERVQSVNHRASLIQRIFGVCSVSIDTAGGATNKAVRVPYVRLETAERIRMDLFTRKAAAAAGIPIVFDPRTVSAPGGQYPQSGGAGAPYVVGAAPQAPGAPQTASVSQDSEVPRPPQPSVNRAPNTLESVAGDLGRIRGAFGGAAMGMPVASYELGLSNRELLLTGISHSSSATAGLLLGLIGLISSASFIMPAFDVSGYLALGIVGASVVLAVIMLLIGWVLGFAGICISFGGFRARRCGSRIEVERGLLQREYSGIDVSRVQSVVIRQSVIRRLMGYCEISLGRIDVADDQRSNQNSSKLNRAGLIIHPFIKMNRVEEVLHGLLPEFDDKPLVAEMHTLPRVSLRRAIIRRCIWYNLWLWFAVAMAIIQVILNQLQTTSPAVFSDPDLAAFMLAFGPICTILYVICAIATVLHVVSAVLWFRNSGFNVNRGYALMRNDGLRTECVYIPRSKIQSGYTRTNPFQRHSKVTGIIAETAAGAGHTNVRLLDVTIQDGQLWLDWMVPRRA